MPPPLKPSSSPPFSFIQSSKVFPNRTGRFLGLGPGDFGKGSGHAGKLNFGDCFAYALARATGQPLLFKGDDFIHTDVVPALG